MKLPDGKTLDFIILVGQFEFLERFTCNTERNEQREEHSSK